MEDINVTEDIISEGESVGTLLEWPPFSADFYNFLFVNINTVIPPCRTETLNNVVAMVQRGEEKRETIDQAEREEGSEVKPVSVCSD